MVVKVDLVKIQNSRQSRRLKINTNKYSLSYQ